MVLRIPDPRAPHQETSCSSPLASSVAIGSLDQGRGPSAHSGLGLRVLRSEMENGSSTSIGTKSVLHFRDHPWEEHIGGLECIFTCGWGEGGRT